MSAPPQAILDAVAKVTYVVPGVEACMAYVSVRYSEFWDALIIEHPDPKCVCKLNAAGPEAVSLARYIDELIGQHANPGSRLVAVVTEVPGSRTCALVGSRGTSKRLMKGLASGAFVCCGWRANTGDHVA
jgi:hypothetical protein